MKKNNTLLVFVCCVNCILLVIIALFIIRIIVVKNKTVTGEELYQKNISATVELKASSENRESYGTAFFINDNTLLSNAHLVFYTSTGILQEYENLEIRFAFSSEYIPVKLIKYDVNTDLALLKLEEYVDHDNVVFSSEKLENGMNVYAIGNTQNYGIGISKGILSKKELVVIVDGKNRSVLQLDLSVSEGNSGGPIFDEKGYCIGVISFRLKDTNGSLNYGFCYGVPHFIVTDFINESY